MEPRRDGALEHGGEWRTAALAGTGTDVVLSERLWDGKRVQAGGPVLFVGLDRDPADEYNLCFARAHGLRSVRAVPE